MFHRGQKRITAAEVEHMERVRALGCVCCAQFGVIYFWPIEAHHLTSGGKRMGHTYCIPLCSSHHRGTPFTLYQTLMIPKEARVSIASGSKLFTKHYGTERNLYEAVCHKLGLESQWPQTKILPRRVG